MKARTVAHSTFVIDRSYPTAAARVFAAFQDPVKKRRWFDEVEGFTIEHWEMDFRVGGADRSRFRHKGGPLVTYDGIYQDIVPGQRIVYVYTMTFDGKPLSSSLTTIELLPSGNATDLILTEQGAYFGEVDQARGREEGIRGALERLAEELKRAD